MARPQRPGITEAIMDATIELLGEVGVEGTTVEAIAARAGTGRPSIYRRWESREALISDAALVASNRAVPVPDTGSLREDLCILLEEFIAAMSAPLGRASASMIAHAASHPAETDGPGPQHQRRQLTREIIVRAQARGDLANDIDPDLLMDLVVAPVWMALLVWRSPLAELDATAIVDTVLNGALHRPAAGGAKTGFAS